MTQKNHYNGLSPYNNQSNGGASGAHNEEPQEFHPITTLQPTDPNSEEVQEILGKVPNWIIRQGTTLLFVVALILLAGSYFIRYPDVLLTSATIVSSNPPVKMVAQASGNIEKLFIGNGQTITRNEVICLIANSANYQDVLALKTRLEQLDKSADLSATIREVSLGDHLQLGELQSDYAILIQSLNQYRFFLSGDFASHKIAQLKTEVNYQSQLSAELRHKDSLMAVQLELQRKKYQADSSLVSDKVIAPLEFDNSRKDLIATQLNNDANRTTMIQNKLQQTEYQRSITDLQQQQSAQANELTEKIRETVKRLQGSIAAWELKYVLRSPVDGKVAFFKYWKENQYVSAGEPVLMVIPPVQTYIARAFLPISGAGKVRVGQKVLIKLSAYPFEEYGMIRGNVETVSAVSLDTAFMLEIRLSDGLNTSSGRSIPPQPQLSGIAEVLTTDRNIFQRLFSIIRKGTSV